MPYLNFTDARALADESCRYFGGDHSPCRVQIQFLLVDDESGNTEVISRPWK
jgi:hypothetical protein